MLYVCIVFYCICILFTLICIFFACAQQQHQHQIEYEILWKTNVSILALCDISPVQFAIVVAPAAVGGCDAFYFNAIFVNYAFIVVKKCERPKNEMEKVHNKNDVVIRVCLLQPKKDWIGWFVFGLT